MKWMALALLFVLGCNPGPYPTDIYPEMHYAPAQRRGEPTRLAPGPDAVPITGARPRYTFDQATALINPVQAQPQGTQDLYRVNCAMCHGSDGHGRSLVAEEFKAAGAVPPVDLTSQRVRGRTDGQVWWIVGNGLGNMPAFGNLLTDQQLWALVRLIRDLQ